MSKYLDSNNYAAIHEQAGKVIKNRKHLKRSAIERYLKHFDEKCATSKVNAEEAKKYIPGGIQHNLGNNYPFALDIVKADRAYLYDVDGNKYIDFLCAGGPTILGNNFPALRDITLKYIAETAPTSGLYSTYELEFSKLICKYYPSVERVRMLGSGTEADMVALRLVRDYTGKKHIIRIAGNYHGWSDQLVYNATQIKTPGEMIRGIPSDCFQYTHPVPVNNLEALEAEILKYKDEGVAAFFMEGVGQDSGGVPTTREYNQGAEKLCRKYGMLLVYDEVVTGFRLGMGGAQAYWGTTPDLTVFGKIIGGGYPAAAALAGRADIMDRLQAGVGLKSNTMVKVGGTLAANPLTALAGITTIKELERLNVHEKLDAAATRFMQGLADITEKYDVPAVLFNHQSILHIDVGGLQHLQYHYKANDPELAAHIQDAYDNAIELSMALAAEGLINSGGGKTYMCYDSIDVVDDALAIYDKVFSQYE